jgi:putative intracellular protease/amidase
MFSSAYTWKEKVVVDGRLITGQNPPSASALGAQIINALKQTNNEL